MFLMVIPYVFNLLQNFSPFSFSFHLIFSLGKKLEIVYINSSEISLVIHLVRNYFPYSWKSL